MTSGISMTPNVELFDIRCQEKMSINSTHAMSISPTIAPMKMQEILGRRLQELRGKTNQMDVAVAVGISRPTLSGIERGKAWPSRHTLQALASFYGASLDMLLAGIEIPIEKSREFVKDEDEARVLAWWRDLSEPEKSLIRRGFPPPIDQNKAG